MKKLLLLLLAPLYLYILPACNIKNETDVVNQKSEKDDAQAEIYKALEFEFNMTKDPTGKIPENIQALELAQARSLASSNQSNQRITANTYAFQGPDNLGGRTRTIAFDVRYNGVTNNTILSGGISGGVWKSTDGGASWVRKSPVNQHYSCTSIAQDTRLGQQDTWYYTTGEALGNSASSTNSAFYFGNGVYKSIDNGEIWSRLPSSNTSFLESFTVPEDLITKVVVSPVDGNIYTACLAAIKRSTDGGATWANVLSGTLANASQVTDLSITSTGRLYAAFSGTCPTTVDGVWTSTSGDFGAWTRIAGTGVATNPTGWDLRNDYQRVVTAIAPGKESILYVMYVKATAGVSFTSSCTGTPAPEAKLFRYNQSDSSWANLSANLPDEAGCLEGNDPFAVQGGYDLVLAVHPIDTNLVLIGGTNAYRSTDGFTSTTNTTRIGGYVSPTSFGHYANSHPDIHSFTFVPGVVSGNALLCGNDGGIQRTDDVTASTVSWTNISNGFRTYQYYYVAIDPRFGNTKVLGGAQDNGSTRNIGGAGVNFEIAFGGDGVSVGLSDDIGGSTYEYIGSQSGNIRRRNSTSALGATTNLRPPSANANGLFITVFHLDNDNTQNLYYVNNDTIFRSSSASTLTPSGWTKLTGVSDLVTGSITSLATTRGAYAATSNLFFGTNGGKLFRLTDPVSADPTTAPSDISGPSFPATGFLSSISVNPRNDDTVLVTFSNYGVTSVFWTGNAKAVTPTWLNVEGSFTLPSYRSSAIAIIGGAAEYLVGTSVGLYKSTIDGSAPAATSWVQEGVSEMGFAVISNLKLRPSDNNLLVGTHGYGMWRTVLMSSVMPVTISSFSGLAEKNYNTLTWNVSNEINSKGYFIERRYKDQLSFLQAGFIAAKGDGTNLSAGYNFSDVTTDLSVSQTFYRLKQTDKDGHFKYSSVINLNRRPSPKLVEYISANKNELLLRLNNTGAEKLSVRITDMNGRQLIRRDVNASTQHIPIAHLPSGSYLAEVFIGINRAYTQKFVK